ncbi:MAG: protein-L-isoaspartate(D-aspartate) O-methyltransferase [Aeoliella sp.]
MRASSNTTDVEVFSRKRREMVKHQVVRRGVTNCRVLDAMLLVPREEFVPTLFRRDAYADNALPIEYGQTISQPFTVAYMAQALDLDGSEQVLEIGTGSGYAAAVLSRVARTVHTIERIPELGRQAKQRLKRLGYANVHVHIGDGSRGLPEFAPFDAIVAAACAMVLPEPYIQQVADGGRIVIPIGTSMRQSLCRFTRRGAKLAREDLGEFAFVPLISQPNQEDGGL